MKKILKLVLLFLALHHQVGAQIENTFVPINGLPSKEVYSLLVDKKGFLWIGHELGLSRYDGISLTNFTCTNQVSLSISDLLEDENGRIWCHNFSGQLFCVEKEKMVEITDYDYTKEDAYPKIGLLDKELLVTSKQGLFIYHTGNHQKKYIFKTSNDQKAQSTESIAIASNFAILYGKKQMYAYNTATGLKPITVCSMDSNNKPFKIMGIYANTTNDTVFGLDNNQTQIHKLLLRNDTLVCVGTVQCYSRVTYISKSNINKYWIHASKLSQLNDGTIQIHNKNISDIVVDHENNYWLSSLTGGLYFIPKKKAWEVKKDVFLNKDEFVKTFIASTKGIIKVTNLGNVYIGNQPNKKSVLQLPQNAGEVVNIVEVNKSEYLIITGNALVHLNIQTSIIKTYMDKVAVKKAIVDKEYIYLATAGGFKIISSHLEKEPRFVTVTGKNATKDNTEANFNTNQRSRSIAYNLSTDQMYVAYKTGLYKLTQGGYKPILYQNMPIYATDLILHKNKLVIATMSNGLLIMEDNRIKNITTKDGLTSNSIIKLQQTQEYIWLLGAGLVQVINLKTEKIENNWALPDIHGTEVYDIKIIENKNWIATNSGIYEFTLQNNKEQKKPVNHLLFVTTDFTDTIYNNHSSISYSHNNIQFHIAALWYSKPLTLQIKYRLLGSTNQSWQMVSALQKTVNFSALEAGNYTFEAVAVNEYGIEAETPIVYKFVVTKPWWMQWWVYAIIAGIIIDIAYLIVQQRINNINKRNTLDLNNVQLEAQLRNSMLTAMKSQMNPHFIFNALNTIQSYIYTNDKRKASSYLGKFSNLIRTILSASNKINVTLTEEIEMLQLYIDLEEMRFEDNFEATIVVDPELNTDTIQIPPMLIQPYVENAIKHGLLHKESNRQLSISFQLMKEVNAVHIQIDDNGIGRKQSGLLYKKKNEGLGFSTNANDKRIHILNQTLKNKIDISFIDKKDAEGNATGTTVLISFPLEMVRFN